MNEKTLIIVCVTAVICVSIICGTILLTQHQNHETINNSTNTSVNLTSDESGSVVDTTNVSTSSSKTSQSTSKESSYSSEATGDNVPTVDSNGNRVFRDGIWVGRGPGGAHIYKDPRSGELFDSGGNLPSNYKYDPI